MESIPILPLLVLVILLLWSSLNSYIAWFKPDLARKHNQSGQLSEKATERLLRCFVQWGASDFTLWFIRLMGPFVTIVLFVVLIWILLHEIGI